MNKYNVYCPEYLMVRVEADYYKLEEGYLNFYVKVTNPNTGINTYTKAASFNRWSYVERLPIE